MADKNKKAKKNNGDGINEPLIEKKDDPFDLEGANN